MELISEEELTEVIWKLKIAKLPGWDNITLDMIKFVNDKIRRRLKEY